MCGRSRDRPDVPCNYTTLVHVRKKHAGMKMSKGNLVQQRDSPRKNSLIALARGSSTNLGYENWTRDRGRDRIFKRKKKMVKKKETEHSWRSPTASFYRPRTYTPHSVVWKEESIVRIATAPCASKSLGARWLEEETPIYVVAENSFSLYAVSWLPRLSKSLLSFSAHTCGFGTY